MKKLSIIIPCYNEAESIPALVDEITDSMTRDDIEVVLVNDGSKDNSAEVLREVTQGSPFITVVTNQTNQGYGGAVLAGLRAGQGEYLGWMHGDLQTPFPFVLKALEKIEELGNPKNIFVKGTRRGRSFFDNFFTTGMSIFETLLLQKPLSDINAQPNIFHRSFFETWEEPPRDFSLDLFAFFMAREKKLKVVRIPVVFPPRQHGHSTWNTGIASRIKFIKRTVLFSLKLQARLGASFITYVLAGGIAGAIHLSLLYIFTDIFNIYYLISTSVAFFIVFWISFALQKYWTFAEHSTHRIPGQAMKYVVMHTGNFFANAALMYLLVSVLGVWYMLAQAIVSLSIALITFTLNKRFIFNKI